MIDIIKKVLLIGPEDRRKTCLASLQKEGVMQVEKYRGTLFPAVQEDVDKSRSAHILSVHKKLVRYENQLKKKGTLDTYLESQTCEDLNAQSVADNLVEYEKKLQQYEEQRDLLTAEYERLRPWGYFDPSWVQDLGDRGDIVVQYWETSLKDLESMIFPDVVSAMEITRSRQQVYFITAAERAVELQGCLEVKLTRPLSEVEDEIDDLSRSIEAVREELYCFVAVRDEVYTMYLKALNHESIQDAAASAVTAADGRIFALVGWVPESEMEALRTLLAEDKVQLIEMEPEEGDRIPTKMANRGTARMGQDLVQIYDTPAHNDWDPSSWIFFSFTLFFAMIMADGGYGLFLLLLTLFLKIKIKNPKAGVRRFINMSFILSIATLVYGIMSGGFFGLPAESAIMRGLSPVVLFDGADIPLMMRTSVLIGMAHISISLLLNTGRLITMFRNFITPVANITWIVAIWAFYFWYNSKESDPATASTALTVMAVSAVIIFLFSAGTFKPVKVLTGGLGGLYNSVQFFSDILSYIRIFALALSGTLIAQTFNKLAFQVYDSGQMGIPFAVLIFVLGHAFNIVLCLQGGVIHGLRLNFLEWYRWNFDGNGRPFKPLRDLLEEN